MTLKIYNTLTKKKEKFVPVEKGKVKMYVCGMTVYSDAHIGHARTYFAFDVIRRYFEYKGYKVTYVQNITDVDDKIIAAANQEGVDPLEYSRRFTEKCLEDLDRLGIRRADVYPKASETIPDMIKMIEEIIRKGYGYVSDGDVYFSVEKFKDYGKLSGQKIDEMKVGARIEPGEQKRNPLDFALWKKSKPGEPSWDSPWGRGRPGWHIECSTMSSKYLGLPFDIHGGGMDLRFPHHENEIAQAEAATDKRFAKYWMHVGLLTINGEKMSKSLGNIVNIRDLLGKWDSEVVRFFFAQTHYRSPPDFNDKALSDAEKGLERIRRLKEKIEGLCKNVSSNKFDVKSLTSSEKKYLDAINDFKEKFEDAMDDDFNTPQAIAVFFDFVNNSNRFFEENKNPSRELCRHALDVLVELGGVLTLFQPTSYRKDASEDPVLLERLYNVVSKYDKKIKKTSIKNLMETIIGFREKARKDKNWGLADKVRKELLDIGFEIQDTRDGPIWRKK
ncbi:MAG: cysteine--tRNA ligase [Candidatus Thermoplasmatota archaeon]|nr:cysteine--tRNA ligase [Candidatus Thermoplasmatota archaeon]